MEIGIVTNCFKDKSWEEICKIAGESGLKNIEPCAGGFDTKEYCNPSSLINDKDRLKEFIKVLDKNDLKISALSIHLNPLHPKKDFSDRHIADLEAAIIFAGMTDVKVICCFAGVPGAGEDAQYPNWITFPWPDYFGQDVITWQWEKKIIPFWKKMSKKAKQNGIKFGFEMHPGDSVYNPESFLRLREGVGEEEIGCTLDPAHFFFQGIDPILVIKKIGSSIVNVHIKDAKINKKKVNFTGVIDLKDFREEFSKRSWVYRNIGHAHGQNFWNDFINTLKAVGYSGSLSLELEDPLVPVLDGLAEGKKFLENILFNSNRKVKK